MQLGPNGFIKDRKATGIFLNRQQVRDLIGKE
jgi:hypothetical protein